MNVETAASGSAAALALAPAVHQLRTPAPGGRGYRREFGLRIRTGGLADAVRLDAAGALLAVEFRPLEYDTRSAGQQPAAEVASLGPQALGVTLPAPVQVRRVRFRDAAAGAQVELYRLDGAALAGEPARSAANGAAVADDFTSLRFGLRLKSGGNYAAIAPGALADVVVKSFPTGARLGIAGAGLEEPLFFWSLNGEVGRGPDASEGNADTGRALAETLQRHLDGLPRPLPAELDIRLVAESDAPCTVRFTAFALPFVLQRTGFGAVLLRGEDLLDARSLAVRLRDRASPLAAYLEAQLSAGLRAGLTRAAGALTPALAGQLRDELNALLQTAAPYTPERFSGVTLSDELRAAAAASPSGVARVRLNRALLAAAFPGEVAPLPEAGAARKEVLRGTGGSQELLLPLDLPRGAQVRAAVLTLEGELRGGSPAVAESDAQTPDDVVRPTELDSAALGVSVDAGTAVALRVALAAPVTAVGTAAALALASPEAELVAELRADAGGLPRGQVLASAALELASLDRAAWADFQFPRPALLPAGECWLVLRAARGSAVWLARTASALVRVGSATNRDWTDRGSFANLQPLWFLRTPVPANDGGGGRTRAGALAAALGVRVGNGAPAPVLATDGARLQVDLAGALQSWLAAQAGSSPVVSAPLRVSLLGSGTITVHPPAVEYEP